MSRRTVAPLLPGFVLVALTAACTGGGLPLEEEPAAGQAARFGLISITYGHDWSASGDQMLLASAAQFVRYSSMGRDHVARLLALPLDTDRDLPPVDRCKLYDLRVDLAGTPSAETEEQGSVELLEAGDLRVETLGRQVTLTPKHFPGLLPFISGVVYGEAEGTLVESADLVRASGNGGEAVGAFAVDLRSPELPRLLRVGEAEPRQALALQRDRGLALRWQPGSAASAGDVTYLELRFSKAGKDMALRCRPRDDGAFVVPQHLVAEVSGKSTLELARVRRAIFAATGLDEAELRVTVRDAATLD